MQSNTNILHDWLHRRGITKEVIEMFGIQSYEHPDIGECIKIPITETHNKYRRNPLDERKPKYLYDVGGKVTLYGYDKLDAVHTTVLITEGEADCLVAWSHNIPAVTSTGGAMSFQEEWAELLSSYEVTLCFDNDDAGAEGMVKVLRYLPTAKIALVPETPGVKDISDYVAKGGDLHALLQTAKVYTSIADIEGDMAERKAHWQSVRFHEKYLDAHRQKAERSSTPNPYTGTDEVLRARAYPIEGILELTRNKALCPFHNESTPSFHYYAENNRAYCFGCGKSYDAIDVYMKVHNCSFKEAIKKMV